MVAVNSSSLCVLSLDQGILGSSCIQVSSTILQFQSIEPEGSRGQPDLSFQAHRLTKLVFSPLGYFAQVGPRSCQNKMLPFGSAEDTLYMQFTLRTF